MSILHENNPLKNAPPIKHRRLWVVSGLLAVAVVFFIAGGVFGYVQGQDYVNKTNLVSQEAAAAAQKPDIYQLWLLTNQDRQAVGLKPLGLDPQLNITAQTKCDDMITQNYFEHTSPQGVGSKDLIGKYYPIGKVYSGENLSEGYRTAQDTENAWLASPGHRENIMRDTFEYIGFAVCGNNTVVEHFLGV